MQVKRINVKSNSNLANKKYIINCFCSTNSEIRLVYFIKDNYFYFAIELINETFNIFN